MTELIPDNPFDPEAFHVPDPLRRLFEAIDNIQREYPGNGSQEAKQSFQTLCAEAVDVIADIAGQEFLYGDALSDHIDCVEEEAKEKQKSNSRSAVKKVIEEFKEKILEAIK